MTYRRNCFILSHCFRLAFNYLCTDHQEHCSWQNFLTKFIVKLCSYLCFFLFLRLRIAYVLIYHFTLSKWPILKYSTLKSSSHPCFFAFSTILFWMLHMPPWIIFFTGWGSNRWVISRLSTERTNICAILCIRMAEDRTIFVAVCEAIITNRLIPFSPHLTTFLARRKASFTCWIKRTLFFAKAQPCC